MSLATPAVAPSSSSAAVKIAEVPVAGMKFWKVLAGTNLSLNRLDDAKKAIEQAQEHKFEGDFLHLAIYQVAFLKADTSEMDRQVAWAAGKPGTEDLLLSFQSDSEAYHGRLVRARDLSPRAVDTAVRADSKETAALWQVNLVMRQPRSRMSRRH